MMMSDTLDEGRIGRIVELALLEDVGLGDLTGEAIVPEAEHGIAEILCKEEGVIAGLEVAAFVFRFCDQSVSFTPVVPEGRTVTPGQVLARVVGSSRSILKAERTALNFLQRMSGIATLTQKFVKAVEGTRARVTDTRKTAPGLRVLDKWAVRLGGGVNHRFGLDDMVLIKENHIAIAGGIDSAVRRCRGFLQKKNVKASIEVETTSLAEVEEALSCQGVSRIMLDNFPVEDMKRAVQITGHRVEVEASGGINLHNIRAVAETGVDFVSIGALTHSAKALDISLELTRLPARSDSSP
jgi:nicotinate-nucleotide pyrophosphorylase (carboxylating)